MHLPLTLTARIRPTAVALTTLTAACVGLHRWSEARDAVFVGGAARLVSLWSGTARLPTAEGWALPLTSTPVIVTAACSATDFYVMVATLLSWHLARRWPRDGGAAAAVASALIIALPLTLLVNALRIIAVAAAHRWVIPRLPPAYDAFLHLLTGAAVFLPALILLNLTLESLHGPLRFTSPNAAA